MPKKRSPLKSEHAEKRSAANEADINLATNLIKALEHVVGSSHEFQEQMQLSEEARKVEAMDDHHMLDSIIKSPIQPKLASIRKRNKRRDGANDVAKSLYKTLYDRSFDLASFSQPTPLYPMCNSWNPNPPTSLKTYKHPTVATIAPDVQPIPAKRDNGHNGKHRVETSTKEAPVMQPPTELPDSRVPPLLDIYQDRRKENINLDYEVNPPPDREVLLREHQQRWAKVKTHWKKYARDIEQRKANIKVLSSIYNKGQGKVDS